MHAEINDEGWLVLGRPPQVQMLARVARPPPEDFVHVPQTFRCRLRGELRRSPRTCATAASILLLVMLGGEWVGVALWLRDVELGYLLALVGLPGALALGLSLAWSTPQAGVFLLASAAQVSSVSHGYAALLLLAVPSQEDGCLLDGSLRCACGLGIVALEVGDVLRTSLAEGARPAWLQQGAQASLERSLEVVRQAASHVVATLAWVWAAAQLHRAICGQDPFARMLSAAAWSQNPALVLCLHGASMVCREGRRALCREVLNHLRSERDWQRLLGFAHSCLRRRRATARRIFLFARRGLPPRAALRALRLARVLGPALLVPAAVAAMGAALPTSALGEGLKLWGACLTMRWTAELCLSEVSREGTLSGSLADAMDLLPGGWGLTERGRQYGKGVLGVLEAFAAVAGSCQAALSSIRVSLRTGASAAGTRPERRSLADPEPPTSLSKPLAAMSVQQPLARLQGSPPLPSAPPRRS